MFFYLLNDIDWGKHTKLLLKQNSKTLIFSAIKNESVEITNFLIEFFKETNESLVKLKMGTKNLLHYLAATSFQGYKELYELLIKQKDMKKEDVLIDKKGNTLLHQAVTARNIGFFRYLIEEQHQSPLVRNKQGKTAFDKIEKFFILEGKKITENKKILQEYRTKWRFRHRKMLAFLSCKMPEYQNIEGNHVNKLPMEIVQEILSYIPSVSKK